VRRRRLLLVLLVRVFITAREAAAVGVEAKSSIVTRKSVKWVGRWLVLVLVVDKGSSCSRGKRGIDEGG
jgi:hypothetical protein